MNGTRKLICIEWFDSAEHMGWTSLKQAETIPDVLPILTVGILLSKPTDKNPFWTVARDVCVGSDLTCGVFRIPKFSVLRHKITTLPMKVT